MMTVIQKTQQYTYNALLLPSLCFFCSLVMFSTTACADNPQQSSQALDQLRLLQQNFMKKTTVDNLRHPQGPDLTRIQPNKAPESPPLLRHTQNEVQNQTASADPILNESIDERAFDSLKQQLFPLTSKQIHRLKEMYHNSEYAQAAPAGTPPKPTATSQFVNLSPGSTPPVIRLSQGFVSSLVFLDSTGAPWPISAYDLGDPAAFNIQWDKTSNTLMIQSNKLYTYGNLAVRLTGLNTPVMLTLIPGQKAVDYRVDLRVQGYGPNAKSMPLEDGLPPSASDVLLHVLDGVPPQASTRLVVSGGDARAWLLDDKMFVRTNLTILSPGWIESMTSADGMHAYEMQKSPVLLVSWHGKVMQLKIEGL